MKDTKRKYSGKAGGLYRNLTISIKLLDAIIIAGLVLTAFLIIVSV